MEKAERQEKQHTIVLFCNSIGAFFAMNSLSERRIEGWRQCEHRKVNIKYWENEKSYPDLQTFVDMSDQFGISLDVLLKEDSKMVKTIDKERMLSKIKHAKSAIDIFSGAGTGKSKF